MSDCHDIKIECFEDIVRLHESWLPTLQANPGIKANACDYYPDKAHFIYELIQNAEDAGASFIEFSLHQNRLEIIHDGRKFTLADIDAITRLGLSTKKDSATSIGKFGMGFKAVLAYTEKPEIHSGQYHFSIREMVVPMALESPFEISEFETKFILPFDKGDPEAAEKDIKEGLLALKDTALLFLTSIQAIRYTIEGASFSLERVNLDNKQLATISTGFDGTIYRAHWLRFTKKVDILDEKGVLRNLGIAIVYRLEQDDKNNWHLVPDNNAKVSIFFPAVKEYCGLKFHIHAPFASTPYRDSLLNCTPNEEICSSIADLAVESLPYIRDHGLLDMSFLDTLPNNNDDLGEMYICIRKKLLEAFRSMAFTPTAKGGYAPAHKLYSASKDFRDVFSDEDMNELIGAEIPVWAASAPLKNSSRADKFMESLQIRSWGWLELKDIDEEVFESLIRMLENREDLWLMHFYAFVGEKFNGDYAAPFRWPFTNLRSEKCIRDFSGNMMEPSQIFFPAPEEKRLPTDIHTVKKEILGRSEAQQRNVRSFLEKMGVREYNEKTLLELALNKYKSRQDGPSSFEDHIRDIRLLLDYFRTSPNDALFSNINFANSFLFYGEKDSEIDLRQLKFLCIDSPFQYSGLREISEAIGKYPLASRYAEYLKSGELNIFVSLLKKLGVVFRLEVEETNLNKHPDYLTILAKTPGRDSYYRESHDYNILSINKILKLNNFNANRLIWMALVDASQKVSKAYYRRSQHGTPYIGESSLVLALKDTAWVPDKEGVFHVPRELSPYQLHDSFPYDDSNGLLTAIEFGKNFYMNQEAHKKKEEAAHQIGFESVEEATELLKFKKEFEREGLNLKSILDDKLSQHRKNTHAPISDEFPRGLSRDIDRHYDKAREKSAEAPQKQYEVRPRSVKTSGSSIDYKTYLREEYTNQEGALFCQMCQHVMPFQELNGTNYYFEGRQLLAEIAQECEANHLALCPLCAAKYKELAQRSISAMDDLKQALREADIEGALEIPLSLGEKEGIAKLRFTQRHLIAIQAMLDS